MTLFESTKVKERCKITDTADDTLITNLGAGADAEVVNQVYKVLKDIPNLKTLPIIDVSAGTVNGSAADQSLKDACTNRVVSAYKAINSDPDMAKFWLKKSDDEIKLFIDKQTVDSGIYGIVID